jgi:two-component sensor histidine kinase
MLAAGSDRLFPSHGDRSDRGEARRRFPLTDPAVSAARHFVADRIPDRRTADTVALLVSELATNARAHGATSFEVRAVFEDRVRVEVSDDGPGWPRVVHAGPEDEAGRGLQIVEGLSERWGAEPLENGKRVWFEI